MTSATPTIALQPLDLVLFRGRDGISNFIQDVERREVVHRLDTEFHAVWSHAGILVTHDILPLDVLEEGRMYIYESVMAGSLLGMTYSKVLPVDHVLDPSNRLAGFRLGPQIRPFADVVAATEGDVAVFALNADDRAKVMKDKKALREKMIEFHAKYHDFTYPNVLASAQQQLHSVIAKAKELIDTHLVKKGVVPAITKSSVFCSELVSLLLIHVGVSGFDSRPAETITPLDLHAMPAYTEDDTDASASLSSLSLQPARRRPTRCAHARVENEVFVIGQFGADVVELSDDDIHRLFPSLNVPKQHWVSSTSGHNNGIPTDAQSVGLVPPTPATEPETTTSPQSPQERTSTTASRAYVGRVRMGKAILIGTTDDTGTCSIAYMGKELRIARDHEILPRWPNMRWVIAHRGWTPARAVRGGSEEDGRALYVARACVGDRGPSGFNCKDGIKVDGRPVVVVGRAAPHLGGALFGFRGKEVLVRTYYEVLVNEDIFQWLFNTGKKE